MQLQLRNPPCGSLPAMAANMTSITRPSCKSGSMCIGIGHSSSAAPARISTTQRLAQRTICRDAPLLRDTAPVAAAPGMHSSHHHHTAAMQQQQFQQQQFQQQQQQQQQQHVFADTSVGKRSSTAVLPELSQMALMVSPSPVTVPGYDMPTPSTAAAAAQPATAAAAQPAFGCNTPLLIDADAHNPNYNKPGLNGLTVGSTSGLETGNFTVSAQMPVLYTVQQVHGIFDTNNKALLRGVVPGSFPLALGPEPTVTAGLRRLVVIDENVERLYGQEIRQYFDLHGVQYKLLPLPTCEENKELQLVTTIAEAIEDFKINRRQEPIIAIGGGVCLDVAGLAANLYRRNTGIIKVPTTVMGVVDASIGIKTAVNFHEKKNKLGTYCPPLGVFYDTSFLNTLDQRHISNGSAEILKMACIKDRELFELLETHAEDLIASNFQGPVGSAALRRSIQGMLEELEYNLWEAVLVRLVDYGHTVSPELEMAALRSPQMLLHGEAVAIDMALSTELAAGRGLLSPQQRSRVLDLMRALRLPLWHEACSVELFMKGLEDMTRARDGLQRVPLMHSLGAATFVNDISALEMVAAAERLVQYAAAHGCAAATGVLQKRGEGGGGVGQAQLHNNVVPYPLGMGQQHVAPFSAGAQLVG